MPSTQAVEFANFFADLGRRSSNPDFDLSTVRDVVETMHLATKEPEGSAMPRSTPVGSRHCGASRPTATQGRCCCTTTWAAA